MCVPVGACARTHACVESQHRGRWPAESRTSFIQLEEDMRDGVDSDGRRATAHMTKFYLQQGKLRTP